MPLYDFRCDTCDTEFESLEKMSVEQIQCKGESCPGVAKRIVSHPRRFDHMGDSANLSSVRFNFNWMDS